MPPLFNPSNFARNRENLFPQVVSANMLCLPKEMKAHVSGLRELNSRIDGTLVELAFAGYSSPSVSVGR